jgi:hypothetical protein
VNAEQKSILITHEAKFDTAEYLTEIAHALRVPIWYYYVANRKTWASSQNVRDYMKRRGAVYMYRCPQPVTWQCWQTRFATALKETKLWSHVTPWFRSWLQICGYPRTIGSSAYSQKLVIRHCSGNITHLYEVVKMSLFFFGPEDGGSMFLWNIGIHLQVHTALQPRRPTPTDLSFGTLWDFLWKFPSIHKI